MTPNEIVVMIANMNNEEQTKVFENLKANGLTDEEVDVIRNMVFFHKLYNNKAFYNNVVETMGTDLYNTLRA